MNTEQIKIDIDISSTFWDQPPRTKIYIDSVVVFQGIVDSARRITHECNLTDGPHELRIMLLGKDGRTQTIMENDRIIKDQLLNIDAVYIDDINLGYTAQTLSEFISEDGTKNSNMVNLGINGTWTLRFTTPVYIWMLENM